MKYFYCLILVNVVVFARPSKDYCSLQKTVLSCNKHLPSTHVYQNITTLELFNLDWDQLDLNRIIEQFPNVHNLSVVGRNICGILPPTRVSKIKVLQLKNLRISHILPNFLDNFPNLETLNLDGNKLQSLHINFTNTNLTELHLFDNKWNCSKSLDWIMQIKKQIIVNSEKLVCHGDPYPGKSILGIADFIQYIQNECPQSCECTLPKVVQNPETHELEPMIEVNCTDRGLTELPDLVPPKTKVLHLENNDIEDLSPLRVNLKYRGVLELYLDNNRIQSIEPLEGSYWLTHFRVFSLSGNKLTELPTYALDNALQQNTNMPNAIRISLGGNPWRCDCLFTPVFQEMLQKFMPQIKDVNEVKCSYVEGDENSLLSIIDLSRSSVCRFPAEYSVQEALDLLNALLGCLIVLILGKLAYDYYHFKKTGRLPWIVSKMP